MPVDVTAGDIYDEIKISTDVGFYLSTSRRTSASSAEDPPSSSSSTEDLNVINADEVRRVKRTMPLSDEDLSISDDLQEVSAVAPMSQNSDTPQEVVVVATASASQISDDHDDVGIRTDVIPWDDSTPHAT